MKATHFMANGVTPCAIMKVDHAGCHRSAASVANDRKLMKGWIESRPHYNRDRLRANPNPRRESAWRGHGIIGMTAEHYDELVVDQGGVCAICTIPPIGRSLAVDHDHSITDRYNVRGLLCQGCNIKISYVDKGLSTPLAEEMLYLAHAGLALAS